MKRLIPVASPFVSVALCCAVFLTVMGVNCALGAASRTDSAAKPLNLQVHVEGFGNVSAADLSAVLRSAAWELRRYCPDAPLRAIEVYHRADHPQIDFQRKPDGRIAIGLTARDTHWAQYSFQFAHEFCHALANSHRPGEAGTFSGPRRPNLWLEESLCETASLFTLQAMSQSWRTAPPYPAWRSYAGWFGAYAQDRLALARRRVPAGKPFAAWFRNNQPALRQNPDLRDQNTVIAGELLPLFEHEPRGWRTLAYLNGGGSAERVESLERHLSHWRTRCPADLRPFLIRLAAVFGITG